MFLLSIMGFFCKGDPQIAHIKKTNDRIRIHGSQVLGISHMYHLSLTKQCEKKKINQNCMSSHKEGYRYIIFTQNHIIYLRFLGGDGHCILLRTEPYYLETLTLTFDSFRYFLLFRENWEVAGRMHDVRGRY